MWSSPGRRVSQGSPASPACIARARQAWRPRQRPREAGKGLTPKSQHHRQDGAGGQERRERQRLPRGRAAVPHQQQRPERCGKDESEEEGLRGEAGEPEDDEEGELDVAHAEGGGPDEAEREYERDEADAGKQPRRMNPFRREQRTAGKRCGEHDSVRDAVLREVDGSDGTERRAEDHQPRELGPLGVEAETGCEEDKRAAASRSGFLSRVHGARGSAVARAFTVSVGSPTTRRSMVGTSRSTSTLTEAEVALACARSSGSLSSTASAVARAWLG